ncbi:MAG TPA: hypothetical protein PLG52_11605 [Anaerolineales bacterium]|nr:hypothetical protein [Anaerolineales bacterium]
MRLFWKGTATVFFYTISGALLIYAATRSLDFITATLPPDQQIIGYLGLAATSGGLLAWLMVFMYKAEGIGQKITAGIMTALDMLGEFGLFTMDTLYQSGKSGMTAQLTPDEIRLVVLSLSGLIALNIFATIIFHLLDSENMRRMRESFVRDQLEQNALKEIEKRGEEIALTLAPALAKQWADEFERKFSDLKSLGLGTVTEDKTPAPGQSQPPAQPKNPPIQPQEAQKTTHEAPEAEIIPVPLALQGFSGNGNGHKK